MSNTNSNIFEASEEFIALEKYISSVPPGSVLSWMKIQQDTGIAMNENNKQKLRGAMHKGRIEYIPIHGQGIKLADPLCGVEVVGRRMLKIDNSVKRGERSNTNIIKRFGPEIPHDERMCLENTAAIFGAIRVYAQSAKVAFAGARDERKRLVSSDASIKGAIVKGKWY
jgi:hypothetical protein